MPTLFGHRAYDVYVICCSKERCYWSYWSNSLDLGVGGVPVNLHGVNRTGWFQWWRGLRGVCQPVLKAYMTHTSDV